MHAKISVFVICVEVIMYLLLHNFYDCTFKYLLPYAQFDQISYHQHDIYLHGKLSTKLLAHTPNKNTKFMFPTFSVGGFRVSQVSHED